MAVTAHVDLCTNRSGSDNSTHQSRRHNPFLKDRTNGRQQSGQTAQHRKTKQHSATAHKKAQNTTNEGLEANGGGGQNTQMTDKMKMQVKL